MQNNKNNKITLKETFALHYRAYKLINQYCPNLFLAGALESVCHFATPYIGIYLAARIINELAGNRNPQVLWQLVLLTLISTLLTELLKSVSTRWKNCKTATFWYGQRKIYADKLLQLDFCSLDDQHTHDMHSQLLQNEQWSGWGLSRCFWIFDSASTSVVSILGAIALTISLFTLQVPDSAGALTILNHPLFILALIIITILVPLLSSLCTLKASSYWVKYADEARFGNRLFGYYGYLAMDRKRALDMRIYNQQNISQHYYKINNAFRPHSPIAKYAAGPMGSLHALSGVLTMLFNGLVYVFVCLKAWAGAFGIGSVTQYISAITKLSQSLSFLLSSVGDMYNNASFLRTTFEFLDIPNEMYQGSLTTEKRADRNYEVEFRNVSFQYPNSETYALRNVSLKFKIGQRLAVVGMNGSGKTTFIKLLCRLYDPTEGEILLNGIDIRKYKYDDYMNIFSVVFQDFKLLPFTLAENVATSKEYNRQLVMDCLNKSGFCENLSEETIEGTGIDTYLYRDFDDKGQEISGGEAQKIAIARALYKNAPFIILDEPTAALDPIAEAEIYSKFNEIAGDKTAIYISHRLSSCRFCDEIAVFHEGQLIQQGNHDELVSDASGKYHKLWHAQAQYYQQANG
uniref:ABC transporter ATP-binding protein n=1 Tax=Acetatifactor sp. TaxID=1872090 RepID=UPI00405775F3